MVVGCESCGKRIDDEFYDTTCPHYPVGTSAATYCREHDTFKGPLGCRVCNVRPSEVYDRNVPRDINSVCLIHDRFKGVGGCPVCNPIADCIADIEEIERPRWSRDATIGMLYLGVLAVWIAGLWFGWWR